MTHTISIKDSLRHFAAIFGFELKKCRTPLIIFAVISAFEVIVSLSLSFVSRSLLLYDTESGTRSAAQSASVFCRISTLLVFLTACVFTIIFTLRAFSYLHNKRKTDWINPMPVYSGVMFFSKAMAAFAAAVVPSLFFFGIIFIITACFGAGVTGEMLSLLLAVPLGSIACISFYGLLAVCCGSSANTVLTFLAISFCYPLSAYFIKGMIDSFFLGLPTNIHGQHFILKALNPLAAYDAGWNSIYWILFTIGCFALSFFLLRRRKAERAQTSFVFHLPCYVVEVLVTFIAGMLLGLIFGSYKVFGYAMPGFAFGFVLGGATAFVIIHAILFKGFGHIVKSVICWGAVCILSLAFVAVCCLASGSYSRYIPERDEIESAGCIEFTPTMQQMPAFSNVTGLINASAGDWSENKIDVIYNKYDSVLDIEKLRTEPIKFRGVLSHSFADFITSLSGYGSERLGLAFRLKDGSVVTRCYDATYLTPTFLDYLFTHVDDDEADYFYQMYYESYYGTGISAITDSPEYKQKYGVVNHLEPQDITEMTVSVGSKTAVLSRNGMPREDIERLFAAFKSDYTGSGCVDGYSVMNITVTSKYDSFRSGIAALSIISAGSYNEFGYNGENLYYVPEDYIKTRDVLHELGVINDEDVINKDSPYYILYNYQYSPGYYSGFYTLYPGEETEICAGTVTVPWECYVEYDGTIPSIFYNEENEPLMFNSTSVPTNFQPGKIALVITESNVFADSFQVLSIESKDDSTVPNVSSGTARVNADGEEMTMRFIQFGSSDYSETYFLTDKVTDEEYKALIDSYR